MSDDGQEPNVPVMSKRAWPIGTPVGLHEDDGAMVETHTTSVPRLYGGQTWGVMVKGRPGPTKLARLTYRVPRSHQARV